MKSHLSIADLIPLYRDEINSRLANVYPKGPASLTKPVRYVLKAGGKRLRPLLTIFTAEACGLKKDDVLPAALAVEILHNFTLVHDDIMDQDHIRHGQKTVHKKWDEGIAILTGDAMLSLALKLLLKSSNSMDKLMNIFIEGLLAVCEGQALDKEFETQKKVTLDEYIRMIDLKTGHLIGLATELGAAAAGMNKHTSKNLRDYGRLIGRAFQIQDDYLEIFSNSENMGKSLESDIVLGKKTFLMIRAMEKSSGDMKEAVELAKSDYHSGISKIRNILKMNGIEESTKNEISEIIKMANEKLNGLHIQKEMLHYFSKLINNRGH